MSNFNQTLETTLKQHCDFIDGEGDLHILEGGQTW